ncbi:MAG: 4Fe-4S dicluster domain-containing protein [Butyrivibrio sp.]|nr:4Fe-4S dicluster domain-containing protein [Butyrivibrio sp.]
MCCGCTACYSICPRNAIKMAPDDEGFLYPQIDQKICISCYRCIQVCPFK